MSVLGFGISVFIVPPVITLMQEFVPEFIVTITTEMMLWVSALGILTGIVASILPARKIAGIDPAFVFKEV